MTREVSIQRVWHLQVNADQNEITLNIWKRTEDFDGNKTPEIREAILANKQIHTITKHNMENAIKQQLQ